MAQKIFIILLFFFISNLARANSMWEERIKAGNSLVNASLSLGYSTYSGSSTYFSPRYQYFIFDGLAQNPRLSVNSRLAPVLITICHLLIGE